MSVATANTALTCLWVGPDSARVDLAKTDGVFEKRPYLRPLFLALEEAGIELIPARKVLEPVKTPYSLESELEKVSIVLVEISEPDPITFFYLGFARAQDKILVTLRRHDGILADALLKQLPGFHIEYEANTLGLEDLNQRFKDTFGAICRAEERDREILLGNHEIVIDWDHLSVTQYENLCLEVFLQRDFHETHWLEKTEEIKVLALRKRKDDPTEIFLVSIGSGLADDFTVRLWEGDYRKALPEVKALVDKVRQSEPDQISVRVNFLFVWSPKVEVFEVRDEIWKELSGKITRLSRGLPVRFGGGVWRRKYLEELVRSSPTILRAYFGDAGDEQTDRHKTVYDLYREASDMGRRANKVIIDRQTPEREEWQEKAYTVTHSIGNAIFPVETYVDVIEEIFQEMDHKEGYEAAGKAKQSLEKAKIHIRKFKNIASLKDPTLRAMDIMPSIQMALANARAQKVRVDEYFDFEGKVPLVVADKDMIEEIMDELVSNSLHWMNDQREKQIAITLQAASPPDLPESLQESEKRFLWIRFQDSGPGIKKELKAKIFDLFFSQRSTGMGFGLATVAKYVRGFGGDIIETGTSGQGVQFDIFLPISV
jgi:signal transduction histidine kinase